jgi:hypothetical protein
MDPTQPIGHRSRVWRHPALRTGLLVGIGLAGLAVAWVLVANRVPSLDRFAADRNLAAVAVAARLLLVPNCLFLRSPAAMFFSSIVAWTVLAITYRVMESVYGRLAERMGAFHLFMLGGVALGLLATIVWVTRTVLLAQQQPLRATRRRLP